MQSEGANPGEVLGGTYRIERVIGRGGMGVVVAARHLTLHQAVAIKLLPDEQANDAESVARFMREARAVVRLKSEHAIKVTDVGRRKSGAPYFVMELLEGEDLDVMVSRAPLHVNDAVDFILQACEAVAEAHAIGIVHRDLKPRNLFLTTRRDGKRVVKVLDFGLAKPVSAWGNGALTATTAVLGSPHYMSPEQMRATRDVDYRTDIWSLGVCLYELLTRRMPFEAETAPVLCALVLKDTPKPVTEHRLDIPEGLSHVIMRCLEKDPAARFPDVQQLAAALEPFGSSESRGVSMRIAGVLRAVAPTSIPPGETTTSFRAGGAREPGRARDASRSPPGYILAIVSLLLVLGLCGAILIAIHFSRGSEEATPEPKAAATGERAAGATASAMQKKPLVTESTPNKSAASAAASTSAPAPIESAPPATVPIHGKTPPPTPTPPKSSANPADHISDHM